MSYEEFILAMRTLRHAKDYIRRERGTGNLQDSIVRNRAMAMLNDAEYTLTGDYVRGRVSE